MFDLKKDHADLLSYIIERVSQFDPATNDGPGDESVVTYIELGYEFVQSWWIVLIFDTRSDAEPDGEWTNHLEDGIHLLERPHWAEAGERNETEPIDVILMDGSTRTLPVAENDTLAILIGEMFREVMLHARDTGVFDALPLAERCELGVEEFNGIYGWPEYVDRGRENLVSRS